MYARVYARRFVGMCVCVRSYVDLRAYVYMYIYQYVCKYIYMHMYLYVC